jgi:hypothetical protein
MSDKDLQKIKEYLVDIVCNTDDRSIHNAVRGIRWILERIEKEQNND